MIIAFTHTYIHSRSSLAYFVFRHACFLNCLLFLPYRDGLRHLQNCKYHKLAIPYIHYIHTLHIYIYISIHTWTSPCSNPTLACIAFSSRHRQPIARTIWRTHHHHDSLLSQSKEYPITLYVSMYVCMYVCMYVSIYVCF